MNISRLGLVILFLSLVSACLPKVTVQSNVSEITNFQTKSVVVFSLADTEGLEITKNIAEIGVKDKGLSISCTLEEVTRTAQLEASKIGANALIIKQIKSPDAWSTCYSIVADAVYIENIYIHETKIIWEKPRKLKIYDFKADTANRPFEAATYSGFSITPIKRTFKGLARLEVETYFDCKRSYLKQDYNVSFVLNHEQLHFDISEVYARKFVERMQNDSLTLKNASIRGQEILTEVEIEMQSMNDLYDSEVHADTTLQKKWNTKVRLMLEETAPFEEKVIYIRN